MTAAHRTLPLPTYVEVTNLRNDKSVILKVNDRGPFHSERLIDLSYAAAVKLDILGYGTGLVEVRAIDTGGDSRAAAGVQAAAPPSSAGAAGDAIATAPAAAAMASQHTPPAIKSMAVQQRSAGSGDPALFLQVGAFLNQDNALLLQQRIREQVTSDVRIVEGPGRKGTFYKVQVGPLGSIAEADRIARALKPLGISESHSIVQ
jgi:rare lipoprotein A